ncbi:VRR-NUC domain-containing protein [Acidisoma silvae]|uniref:phosphodiesterase I n=1 Tax=Acidisoma silvae TaxID=2802396 RepID=A0A964DY24_9PROT|nr:VRR-NUC domain-containing protein [Acidisoma silvae]MCB8874890.1 VRR-NUC domain-containing protein [Acidisoma silvae]
MRGEAEPDQVEDKDLGISHPWDGSAMQPAPLPYYLDHFMQVLRSVAARYGFLLSEDEARHIDRLRGLTLPAQMLYARLANRLGPCFRVDKLRYPEIAALAPAIAELQAADLLHSCQTGEDSDPLLRCFTLPELTAALRPRDVAAPKQRGALLAWLHDWDARDDWLAGLLARYRVVRLPAKDAWPFLRFLFFGELRDNLSDFVVRELGFLTPEAMAPDQLAIRFHSRTEATDAFRMANLYAEFRVIRETASAAETLAWWQSQGIDRGALTAGQAVFDRLIDRLGRLLERAREPALALALYTASPQGKVRDRHARLLLKDGRRAEAKRLVDAMLAAPRSTEEAYAARHLQRRLSRVRQTSDARSLQKLGRIVHLTHAADTVEEATLLHYRARGWNGIHAENWLWNATFGLLLWDSIYDTGPGTFHSPLQTAPSDLYDIDFYKRRANAIETRLAELAQNGQALSLAQTTFTTKRGLTNPFVPWQDDVIHCVLALIERLPPTGLAAVLRRFAQDIRHHARGFPDLFLWKDNRYRFVEVKSESDQLSPAQYEWVTFFEASGLCVSIDNVVRP